MEVAVFIIAAVMVLGGALGVVLRAQPVHAALSLVLTLIGIAVLFVAQDAQFLAVVQVIVYAGAIVVLFLFVIMLLNLQADVRSTAGPALVFAAAAGVVAFVAFKIVDMIVGLRVSEEDEREGLDIASHGESAYRL